MANRWFTQFFGTAHKKPVLLDCNFVVDPTNDNGLGISSLKGPGIASVFMNTSASFTGDTHTNGVIDNISSTANLSVGMILSGTGITTGTVITQITSATAIAVSPVTTATNAGVTIHYAGVGSPTSTGPAAGYIYVKLQDNYYKYLQGFSAAIAPNSGTDINISGSAVLTVGNPYVITSVGTSTQANWAAMGLPSGIVPAVGEPFIAIKNGSGTGTGKVQAPSYSGVVDIELVGNPNATMGSNFNGAAILGGGSSGAYLIFQCLGQNSVSFTATTTNTSTGLTVVSSTAGLKVGQAISGAGIALGTTIAAIPTSSTVTLSAAATASASAVPMYASPATVIQAPASLSTVQLSFYMSNSFLSVQGG